MSLSDLTRAWTVVATRGRLDRYVDGWFWRIPQAEVATLVSGRLAGLYDTAQRREAAGFVLLARRVG